MTYDNKIEHTYANHKQIIQHNPKSSKSKEHKAEKNKGEQHWATQKYIDQCETRWTIEHWTASNIMELNTKYNNIEPNKT